MMKTLVASALLVLALPNSSSAQSQIVGRPFGMGSGYVATDLTVGGNIGTSSLTISDSSSLETGAVVGFGCPNPEDPTCIQGLKISTMSDGALMNIMRLSPSGNMSLAGGLQLGGNMTFPESFSFGTSQLPVNQVHTNRLFSGELGLESSDGFHTMMFSGSVPNSVFLTLPAENPVPGAVLHVASVSIDQQTSEVAANLAWYKPTRLVVDANIGDVIAGTTLMVPFSLGEFMSEGTAVVSPETPLPQGLIIAYAYVTKAGDVNVAFHNATGADIQGFTKSFFVTVQPFAP